jgi:hypothetical protein
LANRYLNDEDLGDEGRRHAGCHAAGAGDATPTPAAAALLALMPATLLAVAVLTSIPSRTAGQPPVIDSLRTD